MFNVIEIDNTNARPSLVNQEQHKELACDNMLYGNNSYLDWQPNWKSRGL